MESDKVILKLNGFAKGAPTTIAVLRDWGDPISTKKNIEEDVEFELPKDLVGETVIIQLISHEAEPFSAKIPIDNLGMTFTVKFKKDKNDLHNDIDQLQRIDFENAFVKGQFTNRIHNRNRKFKNRQVIIIFYTISIIVSISGIAINSVLGTVAGLLMIIISWQLAPYLSGSKKFGGD